MFSFIIWHWFYLQHFKNRKKRDVAGELQCCRHSFFSICVALVVEESSMTDIYLVTYSKNYLCLCDGVIDSHVMSNVSCCHYWHYSQVMIAYPVQYHPKNFTLNTAFPRILSNRPAIPLPLRFVMALTSFLNNENCSRKRETLTCLHIYVMRIKAKYDRYPTFCAWCLHLSRPMYRYIPLQHATLQRVPPMKKKVGNQGQQSLEKYCTSPGPHPAHRLSLTVWGQWEIRNQTEISVHHARDTTALLLSWRQLLF